MKCISYKFLTVLIFILSISLNTSLNAQEKNKLEGRWNLNIEFAGENLPAWLEISHSGYKNLVGRFVYAIGSARPISEIKVKENTFNFSIPPQWEKGDMDMDFQGTWDNGKLKGIMLYCNGNKYNWTATRAPKLEYVEKPKWEKPITLFNGKDLTGWTAQGDNQWVIENGILKSPKSGANLISTTKYKNFKLHIEFKYPEGSNSGIYLRGRYEVQIADNIGLEPSSIYFGGVYGFLTPNAMVAKKAEEWQSYDITLNGSRVTIVANGKTIITEQNIPGMTGGALDNKEASDGPFLIQGDHGPIAFRNIIVTPML